MTMTQVKLILGYFLITVLSACYHTRAEGPAERAGRHIDSATNSAIESGERAGERMREAGHDVRNRLSEDDDAAERAERRRE